MKIRNISSWMGTILLAVLAVSQVQAQSIDIKPTDSTSQIFKVRTQLEGRGVVIPEDETALKLKVDATFEYDERVIARTSQLKSIRTYSNATAKLNIDNKPMVNQLARGKRVVINQAKGIDQPIQIASLGGPITQNEFELINTPANSLILANIFEKKSVKKGDTWKPKDEVLANFLNIDSIDTSDVQIELSSHDRKRASLVISGKVEGTIDGANTTLDINGSIRFNLAAGVVEQAEITINQDRDIGLLAPGLDATFKIVTQIQPAGSNSSLSDEGLAELRKNASKITDSLLLSPNGTSLSMLHPRSWKVIADQSSRTILRYSKNGRMIGQCDIIPLPNRLAKQSQSLEQFKSVIKTSLAESAGQITGGTQSTTRYGLDWLRVDAKGTVSGVDLQWTYYTISNPDGRRVQLVFTTEPTHVKSFAGRETSLVESIRFHEVEKTPGQNAGYKKPATISGVGNSK